MVSEKTIFLFLEKGRKGVHIISNQLFVSFFILFFTIINSIDTLRKRAWPKLVGLHKYYQTKPQAYSQLLTPKTTNVMQEEQPKFEIDASAVLQDEQEKNQQDSSNALDHLLVESMDAAQIERDVARCTWHLLTGTQRSRRVQYHNKHRKKVGSLLKKKQRRLANLINLTLVDSYALAPSTEDRLRYYQGYHDVACIFLHALGGGNTKPSSEGNDQEDRMGLELPARVLCQVSHSHFRDHLRSNFTSLQTALKVALFPLLYKIDRPVHDHLMDCDMEPFFCLSWVLTWFAHDVRDTQLVKRLFDAFLCSHPLFALYVSIAMMTHPINRTQILSTDCDFAALHQCLAGLPRNSCRVGWKQRWDGGGYESDEEDPGMDDRTASTDLNSEWDHSVVSSANASANASATEKSMSLVTSATINATDSTVAVTSRRA